MKTYLQMTMTFACALLLAVTAATAWYNHRQTTHALDQMATRMDELRLSLNTQAPVAQPASSTPNYNNVYISGTPVQRPGQYAMPMDGLTLRRLMAASGVNTRFVKEIAVRHSPKYSDGTTERISAAALVDLTGPDIDLRNEDLITVVEALR